MEAVSRWLCSFVADGVKVQQHEGTITCGEEVLLCSISLTNPKSLFTNYHEDKIDVSYCDANPEAAREDCKFYIDEVTPRRIQVKCKARRAGRVRVKLDLGKWYLFQGKLEILANEQSIARLIVLNEIFIFLTL